MLDFSRKIKYSPLDLAILKAVPRLPCNRASPDSDALNKPTITVLKRSIRLRRSTILLSRSPSFPPMGSSDMQLSQSQLSVYKRIRPLLEAANMLNDEIRAGRVVGVRGAGGGDENEGTDRAEGNDRAGVDIDESYQLEDEEYEAAELADPSVKLRGIDSPEVYGARVPKAGEIVELCTGSEESTLGREGREIVSVEIEDVLREESTGDIHLQLAYFDGYEDAPLFGSLIVPAKDTFWNLRVWRHISTTQEPAKPAGGGFSFVKVAAVFSPCRRAPYHTRTHSLFSLLTHY